LLLFVNVAVFNVVLISAICYPYISIEKIFVDSAASSQHQVPVGGGRCPFITSTRFRWDKWVKYRAVPAEAESQAESPRLFLKEKLRAADSLPVPEHPRA